MREIADEELDSIVGDAEMWEELEHEQMIHFDELSGPAKPERDGFKERVYKRLLDEFPDYEDPNGPMKVFGWSMSKRRRIDTNAKIYNDYHLMQRALATSCKQLCITKATDEDDKSDKEK